MGHRDLHSALKTEVIGTAEDSGLVIALVRLQHGKEDVTYSLHVDPRTWSTAGLQTTDLLAHLGFQRSSCGFVGGECYARQVENDLNVATFAVDFGRCYDALRQAERHLQACGVFLEHPEGWGAFYGKASRGRPRPYGTGYGDGHTATKSERMKESEDESFQYVFSWLEGGQKGWTTHYRPKHPPLSPEVQAAFSFLGLRQFGQCPEFDFESCHWRFVPLERRGDSFFDSNAEFAHRGFDAHAEHFSGGIEQLLTARAVMESYGMGIWQDSSEAPRSRERAALDNFMTAAKAALKPQTPLPRSRQRSTAAPPEARLYRYDVAISFAGTERPLAEQLAEKVRAAGFEVFYDDFYPEQLWGKDLVTHFDNIYRKDSRYCVMFISQEYADRMWPNHERRSAQARALEEKGQEYILPIKIDDTELDGMPPTVGHLDMKRHTIEQIAEILVKKLKEGGRSGS